MLRCTAILSKMWEITTSMTLVVFLRSRIVSFSLVWIRSLLYIVFALTRGVLWSGSIELFILSLFLYIVNLRQRRRTNRALMMILHKKFIMFFCLRQCMNKLRINLKTFSPILLLQYSIRWKHSRECLKASRPLIRVLVINDNGLWINDFIWDNEYRLIHGWKRFGCKRMEF